MGSSQSCPPSLTAEQEGRRRRQRPERRCRMEGLAAERRKAPVFLGVDTHSEAHVGVVVDGTGRRLGALTVPNSEAGYVELVGWVFGFGALVASGVEGTGSYGAGLSRFLRVRGAGAHPQGPPAPPQARQARRRRRGEAAARAVMAGTASGEPKGADGAAESLRALRVARRSAVKARTQAAKQPPALVCTAPGELREVLRGLPTKHLAGKAARFRCGVGPADPAASTGAGGARRR